MLLADSSHGAREETAQVNSAPGKKKRGKRTYSRWRTTGRKKYEGWDVGAGKKVQQCILVQVDGTYTFKGIQVTGLRSCIWSPQTPPRMSSLADDVNNNIFPDLREKAAGYPHDQGFADEFHRL